VTSEHLLFYTLFSLFSLRLSEKKRLHRSSFGMPGLRLERGREREGGRGRERGGEREVRERRREREVEREGGR